MSIGANDFVNSRQILVSSKPINMYSPSQKGSLLNHQILIPYTLSTQPNLPLTMHFQIPIILAIGAGLASTMALPTTSNSTLEKRAHFGWVASFTDATCTGTSNPNGPRPELTGRQGSCYPFQYVVGNMVGVNFGTGNWQWSGVTFFSDGNCQTLSDFNDYHMVAPGSSGMACLTPAGGSVVNSVSVTDEVLGSGGAR